MKASSSCSKRVSPGFASQCHGPHAHIGVVENAQKSKKTARFPNWVWLKIKELGLCGCWSLVPFTKVPFWYHFLEPHTNGRVLKIHFFRGKLGERPFRELNTVHLLPGLWEKGKGSTHSFVLKAG